MKLSVNTAFLVPCVEADENFVQECVRQTLNLSGVSFASELCLELEVAFVDEKEIKKLNERYRGKSTSTDILSFPDFFADEPVQEAVLPEKGCLCLGQLVVSCADVRKYATMDSVAPRRALAFVLSHGVLHLLGFRHGEEMFAIQDRVTSLLTERDEKTAKTQNAA